MKRLYFLIWILVPLTGIAQQGSRAYTRLADSLFQHHHYSDAAIYYERALKNSPEPGTTMLNIARSFERMNKVEKAEEWYAKAKANGATFTFIDSYEYAQVLLMQNKVDEAYRMLSQIPGADGEESFTHQLLMDIRNSGKFYADSASFSTRTLPINSTASEFAPVYYQDGIVFTSSREANTKNKYHWDGSNFLGMFFTRPVAGGYSQPELFSKDLDSRYHDGPATFYDNGTKMILNRNKQVQLEGRENTWIWHLGLYESYLGPDGKWIVSVVPFDVPSYSFLHPSITPDGEHLYFASDMPGGYGGTDLYKVSRLHNGQWGKPFNLGPTVNTSENEVFPFISGQTLYFSSNGRGGLGGLDIFKTYLKLNGYAPPINMGYPINSRQDDFSYIVHVDGTSGYFASSRTGTDDLFEFTYKPSLWIAAHVYDAANHLSLEGASIDIMTGTGNDTTLTADKDGRVRFSLPKDEPFVLIANKDGKTGMLSAIVKPEEDENKYTHPVPAFGDPEKVAMVGYIKNEDGIAAHARKIVIRDATTGEVVDIQEDQPIASFLAEKGKNYSVVIYNNRGDSTMQALEVAMDDQGTKTWEMIIKPNEIKRVYAVRVFDESNNMPLAQASVRVITFADSDLELTADQNGVAEFTLLEGTAYMVIGSKDGLSGMHSGIADSESDKTHLTHPVPARTADQTSLPVMVLVTDEMGEMIDPFSVTVVDEATGQSVPVQMKDGVISYDGKKDHTYTIHVQQDGFESVKEYVTVPSTAEGSEKVSISLVRKESQSITLSARAFKAEDQLPMANADIHVVTIVEPDIRLTANEAGEVTFSLPLGTAFVILANSQNFSGMNSGEAVSETEIPVPMSSLQENQAPVLVRVEDRSGNSITDSKVVVRDTNTGELIEAQAVGQGLFVFQGNKGSTYSIEAAISDQVLKENISIPTGTSDPTKVTLTTPFITDEGEAFLTMDADFYYEPSNDPARLANITLTIGTESRTITADLEGHLQFALPDDASFLIVANKDGFNGMYTGRATTETSHQVIRVPMRKLEANEVPVAMRVQDSNSRSLDQGEVEVIEKESGEIVQSEFNNGIVTFVGENEKNYEVRVKQDNELITSASVKPSGKLFSETILVPTAAVAGVALASTDKSDPEPVTIRANVFSAEDKKPMANTNVRVVTSDGSEYSVTTNENGEASFEVPEGSSYVIIADGQGYSGRSSAENTSTSTIDLPVSRVGTESSTPVTVRVEDSGGQPVTDAQLTVRNTQTGETKTVQSVGGGLFVFDGDKGSEYELVSTAGNGSVKKNLNIDGNDPNPVSVTLSAPQTAIGEDKPVVMVPVKIFGLDASTETPLSNADVTIMTASGDDIHLTTNADGMASFELPEGTAFVVLVSKGALTGMHSGVVTTDEEHPEAAYTILAQRDDQLHAVAGLIKDKNGRIVRRATVTITDKTTGETQTLEVESGTLAFMAGSNKTYEIRVSADGHEDWTQTIQTGSEGNRPESLSIALVPKTLPIPVTSAVVAVKNGEETSKLYLLKEGQPSEIIERDGVLYLTSSGAEKELGKGSIDQLTSSIPSMSSRLGVSENAITSIQNIYFDFDSYQLTATSSKELRKVAGVMSAFPELNLVINGHADDRGTETYNYNLSRKRTRSIETFLNQNGVNRSRVAQRAYGESTPATKCTGPGCTEEQHRLNRRAEFTLVASLPDDVEPGPTQATSPGSSSSLAYADILLQYGDKQLDGLVFKVTIGAYRYNHSLTFNELHDLGKVETKLSNGVMYYYLASFTTLNEVEKARQEVRLRGVTDASIRITYQGKTISITQMVALFN